MGDRKYKLGKISQSKSLSNVFFLILIFGLYAVSFGQSSRSVIDFEKFNRAYHWNKEIRNPIDDPNDYDVVLEDILGSRVRKKVIVSEQKKAKYDVSESLTSVAHSRDYKVLLFRKDIFSKKRNATLILYRLKDSSFSYFPFSNPYRLVEKEEALIKEYQLFKRPILIEVNPNMILDHPNLPVKLSLEWKKNSDFVGYLNLNLIDGRNRILGSGVAFTGWLSDRPRLIEFFYSPDGLVAVFVVAYEVFNKHSLERRIKVMAIDFDKVINDKDLRLLVRDNFRLATKHRKQFLVEYYFNSDGTPQSRFNHFYGGLVELDASFAQ